MARLLIQWLLAFYPAGFREEFAGEMTSVFLDRCARARAGRGPWGVLTLLAREIPNIIKQAIVERSGLGSGGGRRVRRDRKRKGVNVFESIGRDIFYAVRTFAKAPAFTLTVVGTLALGIGANTAIFSVVHAVLLTPPPYDTPDELVMVWESFPARGYTRNVLSPRNFRAWREENEVFSGMAAMFERSLNLTGEGDPQVVSVAFVSTDLFEILGVRPLLGRRFAPEEISRATGYVAILEFGFWQRQFGGDTEVIGRTIVLQDNSVEVVGVMPQGFDFPSEPDMWSPMPLEDRQWENTGRFLTSIARVRPELTVQQAQAGMDAMAAALRERYPDANDGWGINVVPLHEQVTGGVRPALLVLLGAVAAVLLIACANVANLLLGRAAARGKEMAIRIALGAGRGRLVGQLLTESAVLTSAAMLAGLLVAFVAVRALVAFGPADIPRLEAIGLEGPVLVFALAIAAFTGMAFGLVPALHLSKSDTQSQLKEGGKTSAISGGQRVRGLLVVTEIALAMVLLIGAGLLVRSFQRLLDVDVGFDPNQVLSLEVQLPGARYPNSTAQVGFFNEAVFRMGLLRQVESASLISFLPLDGIGAGTDFLIDELPVPSARGDWPSANVRAVHHDYFATMRIPVLRGRVFDGTEREDAEVFPIVINKSMADRFWRDENPLGKTITMPWGDLMHGEVIGVVGNVLHQGLASTPRPKIYWSHHQFPYNFTSFVIRTNVDPLDALPMIQRQVWALDPHLPLSDIRTMGERLGASHAQRRFNVLLLGAFAAVAVILACVGIYGVISYAVSQRMHELGLRMALGATPADVLRLVVGQGLALTGAAVAIGLVTAFAVTRTMSSLLFQVSSLDPLTFSGVAILLSGVAIAACWLPARRATKVDPMVALRTE